MLNALLRKKRPPKIFISYSWENKHHIRWVERIAIDLRACGAAVTLDQWSMAPGVHMAQYMTKAVAKSDYVLMICTEKWGGTSLPPEERSFDSCQP